MHGDELTKLECTIAAILATAGVRQGATENEISFATLRCSRS
jgi:hypothetical protein